MLSEGTEFLLPVRDGVFEHPAKVADFQNSQHGRKSEEALGEA
jgi:hypothetical protein